MCSWRTPVAVLLIVAGCVLAPVSVLAVWTANQVSDTSRYVANVAPLIKDPAIQNALTDKLTSQIVTQIDVKGRTCQAAAERPPGNSRRPVGPRRPQQWTRRQQRPGHPRHHAPGGRRQAGPRRAWADDRRQDPHRPRPFALFPSKNLAKAQKAYRLINDLKIVLPIVTLMLLGAGVWVARGHRRALIGAGFGFAASMLVLGAGLAIARAIYLNSVPASASADAAAAAFDILVRFIKTAFRTLLVVGLVVAMGALFTGSSAAAVRTRSAISSGIGTAVVTIVIAILLLVALGLIELIGRPPPQCAPTTRHQ